MELSEFVRCALLDVRRAIQDSNSECTSKVFAIGASPDTDNIEFDIAVTTESAQKKSGQAKISVWGQGVGGEAEGITKNSEVSRMRFRVHINMVQ